MADGGPVQIAEQIFVCTEELIGFQKFELTADGVFPVPCCRANDVRFAAANFLQQAGASGCGRQGLFGNQFAEDTGLTLPDDGMAHGCQSHFSRYIVGAKDILFHRLEKFRVRSFLTDLKDQRCHVGPDGIDAHVELSAEGCGVHDHLTDATITPGHLSH